MSMNIVCPLCNMSYNSKGFVFHLKNKHTADYEKYGYRKIRNMANKTMEKLISDDLPKTLPEAPKEEPKIIPIKESDIEALYEKSKKSMSFYPTPAVLSIINMFKDDTDPTNFVNKSIINEGRRRGVEAAIIKTEGGKSVNLMSGHDSDKDLTNLLKIMATQAQVNQSYNPNTPTIQMMQMMKERVNSGMGMGQFGKELMQMIFMMKIMEGV